MYHPIQSLRSSKNAELTAPVIRLHPAETVATKSCFYQEKASICVSDDMTDDNIADSGLQIKAQRSHALSGAPVTDGHLLTFVPGLCFIVYIWEK